MHAAVETPARRPSRPRPVSTFRTDVQGLRAVAVGLVVLSHARVPGFAGGYIGVDVFFVISGFLITGLLLKDAGSGRVGFATFYARRALRILPAATLVILATSVASLQLLNFLRAKQVLTDSIWASLFAANMRFSSNGTDYFSHDAVSPLQHYWSLAVEEQFYVVWPALLALTLFGTRAFRRGEPARRRRKLPRRRVGWVLALVTVLSLTYSAHLTGTHPTQAYFSALARTWELTLGALLAVGLPAVEQLRAPVRAVLGWTGLTAVLVAALAFDETTKIPGTAALLPVLGTCAVLAGGVGAPARGTTELLSKRPMRFVGDISYSLYLWHWPVLILGAEYAGHQLGLGVNLLLVALAVLLSTASYHLVENPLRHSGRLWGPKPQHSLITWPLALGAVALLVVFGQPSDPTAGHARVVADKTIPAGAPEVKAAVEAAAKGSPVPGSLQPAFSQLLGDFTSLGACSGYKKTTSKICQYGDPAGTKRVVVIGNSHATMWVPGLSLVAKQAGWQLTPLVKEACDWPEFLGSKRNAQCGQWYQWAVGQVRALHPDLIMIEGYDGGSGWQQALGQAVTDLKPLATRTLLFSDAPGVAQKPFDCLLHSSATLQSCTFALPQNKIDADQSQKELAASEGVDFLSVRPWFCYQGQCPSVVGGDVVYADIGHITATYARHLAPVLADRLRLS